MFSSLQGYIVQFAKIKKHVPFHPSLKPELICSLEMHTSWKIDGLGNNDKPAVYQCAFEENILTV